MKSLDIILPVLLFFYTHILPMEEKSKILKIPDVETICTVLNREDSKNFFLRPDQDHIYTPEHFMQNLNSSSQDLKNKINNYCKFVERKVKNQITPTCTYPDEPNSYLKNKPQDPCKIMFMLRYFKNPKRTADIGCIKGGLWVLQKMYSMETGIDLLNLDIECCLFLNLIDLDKVQKKKEELKKIFQNDIVT